MKLQARADILLGSKRFKAGTIFEVSEGDAELLLKQAWADEVAEEIKAPAKPKKATKKK